MMDNSYKSRLEQLKMKRMNDRRPSHNLDVISQSNRSERTQMTEKYAANHYFGQEQEQTPSNHWKSTQENSGQHLGQLQAPIQVDGL